MKKILFIITLFITNILSANNLHTMNDKIGKDCTLNRGELTFEDDLCDDKDTIYLEIEYEEDEESYNLLEKGFYFDSYEDNMINNIFNMGYLFYNENGKEMFL